MSLTLGMTGMDPATETALRAAFGEANARVGGRWSLVPETDAGHVMVDMDSMYGPMSWLRLHAAGKRVIGLTTAPRTQTDFRLGRPFDGVAFAALLRDVERDSGVLPDASSDAAAGVTLEAAPAAVERPSAADLIPAPAAAAASIGHAATTPVAAESAETAAAALRPLPAEAIAAAGIATPTPHDLAALPEPVALTPAAPSGSTHAPAPQDQLPDEALVSVDEGDAAAPDDEPTPVQAAPVARTLADWLAPGMLAGRTRYRRSAGPMLLIDPIARTYHGPSTLKPFSAYFRDSVAEADFESLDDAAWARDSAVAGVAQPLLRLQWLGGMVSGRASLGSDHAQGTRFRLTKWPQTEREFPKHFRIATAMMKGPSTLAEIAEASTMPIDEVFEFVNANLVTGFAERLVEVPVEAPANAPHTGGLLGRFRAR